MDQRNLYVIAGPNGSGKSTFSKSLTQLEKVIDGDVELQLRRKQFPDISSSNLLEAMNEYWFPNLVQDAIRDKKDFGFETNFNDESIMKVIKQFQDAGYITHLYFIGLSSLELSVKRVMQRVSQGGHDVENSNIEFNYNAGLANLEKHGAFFDKTWILESTDENKGLTSPKLVCKSAKNLLMERALTIPQWAKAFIQQLEQPKLTIKNKKSQSKRGGFHL